MKTLVLLGPYRNLTTLTTALLSLHPNIVAFNHGMIRMPKNVLFYNDPENLSKYEKFVQFILENYQGGKRGSFGGDIRKCHAFDAKHKEMYELMKSEEQQKSFESKSQQAKAVVWKESGRLTKYLRKNGNFKYFARIEKLLKENPNLIFLRPIRNPVDCTQSNIDTDHYMVTDFNRDKFPNAKNKKYAFLRWVINDLIWFLKLEYCFPGRFIHYTESEFPIERILSALDLPPPTPEYSQQIQQGFKILPKPPRAGLQQEFTNIMNKKLNSKKLPPEIKSLLLETMQEYLFPSSPSEASKPPSEVSIPQSK